MLASLYTDQMNVVSAQHQAVSESIGGRSECVLAGAVEVSVGDGGDEGPEHPHGAVP